MAEDGCQGLLLLLSGRVRAQVRQHALYTCLELPQDAAFVGDGDEVALHGALGCGEFLGGGPRNTHEGQHVRVQPRRREQAAVHTAVQPRLLQQGALFFKIGRLLRHDDGEGNDVAGVVGDGESVQHDQALVGQRAVVQVHLAAGRKGLVGGDDEAVVLGVELVHHARLRVVVEHVEDWRHGLPGAPADLQRHEPRPDRGDGPRVLLQAERPHIEAQVGIVFHQHWEDARVVLADLLLHRVGQVVHGSRALQRSQFSRAEEVHCVVRLRQQRNVQ